jgi:Glyoxalase-like domain
VTSGIYSFTVDTPDPFTLATWWSQVLGHPLGKDDFPGDPVVEVVLPVGPPLLFVQTDDPKVVKNRLHLDVVAPGGDVAAEAQRLIGLGATPADVGQGDVAWAVLADPEGNELCVLLDND